MVLLLFAFWRAAVATIPQQNRTKRPPNKVSEMACNMLEDLPDRFRFGLNGLTNIPTLDVGRVEWL